MTDFKVITSSQLTSLAVSESFDVLARITRASPSKAPTVTAMDTKEFVSRLQFMVAEWDQDVRALNSLIDWQHKVIDFNSSYAAYLLDQIDEDEFDKIAEQMASDEQDLSPADIAPTIARILKLTKIDLTPSDIANLFHCSPNTVEEALHMLPKAIIEKHQTLREAAE